MPPLTILCGLAQRLRRIMFVYTISSSQVPTGRAKEVFDATDTFL